MEGSSRGELRPETVRYLLERFAKRWAEVRKANPGAEEDFGAQQDRWPWGVWIRQYGMVPEGFNGSWGSTPFPKVVWFIDEHGIVPRSVWEYFRFEAVQFRRPWISAS